MIDEIENYSTQIVKATDLLYRVLDGQKRSHTDTLEQAKAVLKLIGISPAFSGYELILAEAVNRFEMEVGIKTFNPNLLVKKIDEDNWLYKLKNKVPHAFFDRYKLYLRKQGFQLKAIENIESTCEKILSHCANPNCESKNEHKRGLVMGDVQSGKTANYLGLMNMAYDYGYKIVVLLAGMTNSLRLQTQKRTDSGVIGAKSDTIGNTIEYCGVGFNNKEHYVIPFTNQTNDFAKFIQRNLNAKISDFNKPVVLVVKKNTRILESVIERLKEALKDYDSSSLLVIDDEADYASVNTSRPGNDPTATNRNIRTVFNSFPVATYVGFTATPFANIFINPFDADENFLDLFPSDFLVQLNAPDTYFGGADVFPVDDEEFPPEGDKLPRALRRLDASELNFLPVVHKKTYEYIDLSDSLREAIHSFLLNNVIRTVRGDATAHRSMMINITAFNDVQASVLSKVSEYITELYNIIEQDSEKPAAEFIKNDRMKEIFELFTRSEFYENIRCGNKELNYTPITWNEIQSGLYDEIKQFKTVVVNSRNGKMNQVSGDSMGERFDYEDYEHEGARVIVIGGMVLSRGLTLEGLMVSYYSRNAGAYDTLLQMCRWFGYRPNYKDLCRIYMSQVSIDRFVAALSAVSDLKLQIREMEIGGKAPKDFGLMVKESPNSLETALLVTSRNKMYETQEIIYHLNYGGVYADTSKLSKDPAVNKHNCKYIKQLIDKLKFAEVNGRYMAQNVEPIEIASLIGKIKIPYVNTKFDTQALSEYIETNEIFKSWDVVLATGNSKRSILENDIPDLKAVERSFHGEDEADPYIRLGGSNNRVMDPGVLDAGLKLTSDAKANILKVKNENSEKQYKDLTATDYLKIRKTPILVIYPIDLKDDCEAKKNIKNAFGEEFLWALAIGFPASESAIKVKYRANRIKIEEITRNIEYSDEDEGVDDIDD